MLVFGDFLIIFEIFFFFRMVSRSSDKDGDFVYIVSEVFLILRISFFDRRCLFSDIFKFTYSLIRRILSECFCRDCLGCFGSLKFGGLVVI